MKKITRNNFLIAILLCLTSLTVLAQAPNHTFNYQGQLLDGGSPANGSYDITVSPFFSSVGGTVQGMVSTHLAVDVSNGLFNLSNVDIVDPMGADPFDGFALWLEVGVRLAGGGAFEPLAPRQLMHAVPYADNVTRKGASNGQVLTFIGSKWEPQDNASSPWTVTGTDVSYVGGMVGIGTAAPADANLHISASGVENAIRVQVNGATKLFVRNDGGVAIGGTTGNVAPPDGLSVDGDVKQPANSNGLMKYMVYANCVSGGSIVRSYNGVNASAITIANGTGDVRCVIDFPSDINTRFWQVSPVIDSKDRGAHCVLSGTDKLNCYRYTTSTGVNNSGLIMILVY